VSTLRLGGPGLVNAGLGWWPYPLAGHGLLAYALKEGAHAIR